MKKSLSAVLFFLLLAFPSFGEKIRFSGLNLANDNRLLFKAGAASTGDTLFLTRLVPGSREDPAIIPLSAVPESMELQDGGRTLLVRNSAGAMRIPLSGGLPVPVPGFLFFNGTALRAAPSADGKWLLFLEPVSHTRGNLILLDTQTGTRITASRNLELSGRFFPALWSGDSQGFIYSRNGKLYYHPAGPRTAADAPEERYRFIGDGAINSVSAGTGGVFYYLRGNVIYRLRSSELFARTLYSNFLDAGSVIGKIPFDFDPNFDRFWTAPGGTSMLLAKGGRSLFYIPLSAENAEPSALSSLPYVLASRSGSQIRVFWTARGTITVLISSGPGEKPSAYRIRTVPERGMEKAEFVSLERPPSFNAALSPDETKIVFWGDGAELYDYESWSRTGTVASGPVYSCLWAGKDELICGGARRIDCFDLGTAQRKLLALASVEDCGFEKNSGRILARSGSVWFATDGASPWTEAVTPGLRDISLESPSFRVYLENRTSPLFENFPMVRHTASVGTFPLVSTAESFTSVESKKSRLALCFDLYDDASGLSYTLDTLKQYGITATFFLNGEFIRRNPEAAREIAASGHETASMFYAPLDLSDSRYRIDREFVERGLGRNEDEYYKATGKELSLLWHPPFYSVSSDIISAAAAAGYKTINRDTDPRDWLGRDDLRRLGLEQMSAAEAIDRILEIGQGVIPVRLGAVPGGRDDYLFNSLDVLIEALLKEGCTIVPVSVLQK